MIKIRHLSIILPVFLLLFLNTGVNGQIVLERFDSIPVQINGQNLAHPWAGGLNFVQTSPIDLNQDGTKDLFIFDRSGNKVRTFVHNGTPNAVDYRHAPEYQNVYPFPELHDWALLADYNCDGKEDIFSYSGGGFAVYKNTSDNTNGLQFTKITNLQYSVYNPPNGPLINLYVSSVDIPAIKDIDNDGDLDIVTFALTGTYLEYHQNQSMELYGTCDSLKFEMKNRCWGYASENALSNSFTLNDTCFGNVNNPGITTLNDDERTAERHSGSCVLCIDLDGDNDKELITGDISYNNLTMLTNGGSDTAASMVAVDNAFPGNNSGTPAVDLALFPCGYYVDVNNDQKRDLLASPNATNASENFTSLVYYKNTGTDNAPNFEFQQSNLLQDNSIDVGEGAYPTFFDYNNDGLKDLFVGNYGYYGATGFKRKIALFKNTGTSNTPQYQLITRDYLNLSTLGIINMVPTFGDMDADGDSDMVIGGFDGKLHYFQNIGQPNDTANFVLVEANLRNSNARVIDIGDFATPQIIDLDNDGKNDLVIGARNGKFAYYHHIGSATNTVPQLDSISHFWGNVKVNIPPNITGYSYPLLFKENGVTKLLSGSEKGYLRLYNNIDNNISGTFTLEDSTYFHIHEGIRSAPNMADINNDGFMDLAVGNYSGGVAFYKGKQFTSVDANNKHSKMDFELFPNPANKTIKIRLKGEIENNYTVEIYSPLGNLVMTEKTTNNQLELNTESLTQGIYFCKIHSTAKTAGTFMVKRFVIQH